MSKRVLMVLTNAGKISEDGADGSAGWFLPECAHPYFRFVRAGFSVEFASPLGGFTTVSTSSIDLSDPDNKDYDIVFFVGGFGVMFDFPLNDRVQLISREVYESGGIVGAVCHGPIALANVTLSGGEYLIAGKQVAGFTEDEESAVGYKNLLPMHEGLGQSCEEVLAARGGNFTKAGMWQSHVAVDGRVITGQNPASAGATADAIIATATTV